MLLNIVVALKARNKWDPNYYFLLLLLFKRFEEEDLMNTRAVDERLGMKSDWVRAIIKRFL